MEPPHPTDDTDVLLIVAYHSNDIILMMILIYHDTPVMILIRQLQWWCWYDGSRRLTFPEFTNSGYFSRTRFSCSHMVVNILYYTRKCGCKGGCMSASCFLQPPRNGWTGQVPVLEHETFSRTLLNFKDSHRNTSYMHEVFLGQS